MKIGFIGLGAMSTAIIQGLKNTDSFEAFSIFASSQNYSKLTNNCEALGIHACTSNVELVLKSDVIVLGVKPEDLESLSLEIKEALANKPIISMAAKTTFETLINFFGERPIIRIMPNLNVAINKGSIAMATHNVTNSLEGSVEAMLNLLGSTWKLEEGQFSGFVAMAGSSPALVFRFIDALANAALKEGFSKEAALSIVSHAVIGSATYLSQSEASPETLISRVASKGGTTQEGLNVFDDCDFDETIKKAVDAIIDKDKKG